MEGSGCDKPPRLREFFKADASRDPSSLSPSPSPGSYLRTFPLFLPPPQPPLHSTCLSRREMRSLLDGADVVGLGDGRFSPERHAEKRKFRNASSYFSII